MRRWQAMVDLDTSVLEAQFSDALAYTHSSGGTDTKAGYLAQLRSGALHYEELEFSITRIRVVGSAGVIGGTMRGYAVRGETRHRVGSSYLAVWERGDDQWRLLAMQATNLPARPA
jgi:hypothetical protein